MGLHFSHSFTLAGFTIAVVLFFVFTGVSLKGSSDQVVSCEQKWVLDIDVLDIDVLAKMFE